MEDIAGIKGSALMRAEGVPRILSNLARQISPERLASELKVSHAELRSWQQGRREYSAQDLWRIVLTSYKYGFFDLLTTYGLPSPSYEIAAPFSFLMAPLGFDTEPPLVPLKCRPTKIAGYNVDFPLGLPASILASNSKWIEFYARRGFDILTYKTVRTEYRDPHPWPNWVFVKDPVEMSPTEMVVVGFPGCWPKDLTTLSMANSFGIPSLAPEGWQEDAKKARQVVREGHQVFIVSVVASKHESESVITDDFVEAAMMAKSVGADIVEVNYSCPNVPGDPVGEVYKSPELAGRISKALKSALAETPLFVKIGYLAKPELREFVTFNAPWIDGIVAINTITARVVDDKGQPTFPGRENAGISGWAIKAKAQEVSRNLVALQPDVSRDFKKRLTIFGLGGVLTRRDASDYLDEIKVDAVESCTGAFLNPNLALEVRRDEETEQRKPSIVGFGLEVAGKVLKDIVVHPLSRSRIRIDLARRRVAVEPD